MTSRSLILAAAALAVISGGPLGARAQEASAPASTVIPAVPEAGLEGAWQAVISGQIAAMRIGDGAAALGFAAAPFREGFTDPAKFLIAIASTGYGPLLTSRSETFGKFVVIGPDEVVQSVNVLGADMVVYQAFYDLKREPEGWRVGAVQLAKTSGMGA